MSNESGGFFGSDSADVALDQHYYKAEDKRIPISDKPDPHIKPAICAICGSNIKTSACIRIINTE